MSPWAPTASDVSDTRVALREFFEVNRHHICHCGLSALVSMVKTDRKTLQAAITHYEIDVERAGAVDPLNATAGPTAVMVQTSATLRISRHRDPGQTWRFE